MSIATEALETALVSAQTDIPGLPERFVEPFAQAKKTKKLILDHLGVIDAEIKNYVLFFLNNYPKVKDISLLNNNITDEGVMALIKDRAITHLDLGRNQISDVGLMALAQHPTLSSLNLWDNPLITKTGLGVITLHTVLEENINRNLTILQWAHQSEHLKGLLWLNFQYQRLAPQNINATFVESRVNAINTTGVANIVYAYLGLEAFRKKNDSVTVAKKRKMTT
jgi:hypothetical protein